MIARIKGWLLAALLLAGALLTAWWRGRQSGAADVRERQVADTMAEAEKAAEGVREAHHEVDKMPDGGAADQLRAKWLRK